MNKWEHAWAEPESIALRSTDTPYDRVLHALELHGSQPKLQQGRLVACCPAHDDHNPSLSVRDSNGKALIYCHAGCETRAVVEALGLRMADLFSDRYEYVDLDGLIVRSVVRGYETDGRKRFRQTITPSTPNILYRLPEVLAAVAAGEPVYLVEGEKDADTVAALGVTATTGAQGAGNFHLVDATPLAGAHVIAIVDQDEAGAGWADTVRSRLEDTAATLEFRVPRAGKDTSDHVAAGYGLDDLLPYGDTTKPASWAAIDLGPFLDGTYQPPSPELLPREDGACLLYRGLTHSMHGESESGKSLVAQIEAIRILRGGGRVLYIDFESDAGSIVNRLTEFGASPKQIADGFTYLRPEAKPSSSAAESAAYLRLLEHTYDLAVIDGVTDALGMWGAETRDNDGIAAWARELPRKIADRTGAAVLLIDHVTKDSDSRGRFAIGGQAKLSTLTGAGYTVDVTQPLGRGLRGVIMLRVAKDRPGHVRGHCGPMRPSDRTQEAARITIDSTGASPIVTINGPRSDHADTAKPFRPTTLMEKISRHLETLSEPQSFNDVNRDVSGREQGIRDALTTLVAEEYVTIESGPRNSRMHRHAKPYRQYSDPESDQYQPGIHAGDSQLSPDRLTVSHPYTGGWETDSHRLPETDAETVGDSGDSDPIEAR
jgi:hypothetical protein